MRHYQIKIPPGFILPGLLGIVTLIVLVTVGLFLFGIILAALIVAGIGSVIYRTLFSQKSPDRQNNPRNVRIRAKRSGRIDHIPFTEYTEIESNTEHRKNDGSENP
jgi:hypothetical protein